MDDQLRIGDAERDRAAAELTEHYAEGRLTTEEHAERLDRVWAARTRSDLLPIFRDLPGAHGPVPAGGPRARSADGPSWSPEPRPWAGRRGLPRRLLVVLVVLLAISVVTRVPVFLAGFLVAAFVMSRHRRRAMWGHPWPR